MTIHLVGFNHAAAGGGGGGGSQVLLSTVDAIETNGHTTITKLDLDEDTKFVDLSDDVANINGELSSLNFLDNGRSKSIGKTNNFDKMYASEYASHGNVDFTVNSSQGYMDFWNYDSTNFVRLMIKRTAIWFGAEIKDSSTSPKINLGDVGYEWGETHSLHYYGSGEHLNLNDNRAIIRSISPYDATTSYKENDYVSHNQSLFFANKISPSGEPGVSADWSPAFTGDSSFDLWQELASDDAYRQEIGNELNPLYNIYSDTATIGEIACPRSVLTIKNNSTDTSISIENSSGFVAIKPNPAFSTGLGTGTTFFQFAFIEKVKAGSIISDNKIGFTASLSGSIAVRPGMPLLL